MKAEFLVLCKHFKQFNAWSTSTYRAGEESSGLVSSCLLPEARHQFSLPKENRRAIEVRALEKGAGFTEGLNFIPFELI